MCRKTWVMMIIPMNTKFIWKSTLHCCCHFDLWLFNNRFILFYPSWLNSSWTEQNIFEWTYWWKVLYSIHNYLFMLFIWFTFAVWQVSQFEGIVLDLWINANGHNLHPNQIFSCHYFSLVCVSCKHWTVMFPLINFTTIL